MWRFIVSLVLLLVFAALFMRFSSTGMATRELPSPSDYAAVLVDATSPRNQASIWVSTPKDENIAVAPERDVKLQFYASFETADPETKPPEMGSGEMLDHFQVSYVLADRLARSVEACDGANLKTSLKFDALNPVQRQLASQALPIGGLTEPGPNPSTAAPFSPEVWEFAIVTPSSAKQDGWSSPAGWQPTSVTDFTCTFRPEAFWREGSGAVAFSVPGLYGNLEQEGAQQLAAQQRLMRTFVMSRPDPQGALKFIDGDALPAEDSNRNARYETPDVVSGKSVSLTSVRVWYSDTTFEDVRAQNMFWAGVFGSLAATAALEVLALVREWLVNLYAVKVRRKHGDGNQTT